MLLNRMNTIMKRVYLKPDIIITKCETQTPLAYSIKQQATERLGTQARGSEEYGIPIGTQTMDGGDMYSKGTSFGYVWDD